MNRSLELEKSHMNLDVSIDSQKKSVCSVSEYEKSFDSGCSSSQKKISPVKFESDDELPDV